MKTLIWVDVGDGSPDGVGWIEPTTEVVDIAMAVVVSLLDLNFLVMFDVCNQGNMAISPLSQQAMAPTSGVSPVRNPAARALAAHMPPFPHQLWAQGANSLAPQVHSPMG